MRGGRDRRCWTFRCSISPRSAPRSSAASCSGLGLALADHQSVLLALPAYWGYLLLKGKNYLRPALVVQSLFFFMFGYSVILYIPARAAAGTVFNLGDPDTLARFGWSIKWPELARAMENMLKVWLPRVNLPRLAGGLGLTASLAGLSWLARRKGYALAMFYAALSSFAGIAALTMGATEAKKYGLPDKFYIPAVVFFRSCGRRGGLLGGQEALDG